MEVGALQVLTGGGESKEDDDMVEVGKLQDELLDGTIGGETGRLLEDMGLDRDGIVKPPGDENVDVLVKVDKVLD